MQAVVRGAAESVACVSEVVCLWRLKVRCALETISTGG
jgi:hypothetical protein